MSRGNVPRLDGGVRARGVEDLALGICGHCRDGTGVTLEDLEEREKGVFFFCHVRYFSLAPIFI